jgi:hypothetical protein
MNSLMNKEVMFSQLEPPIYDIILIFHPLEDAG